MRFSVLIFLLLFSVNNYAQQLLRGKVTINGSGEILNQATIHVPALNIRTHTNELGDFSISLPIGKHVLQISHIGFVKEVIIVEFPTVSFLNIALVEQNHVLQEVEVNSGYDKRKIQQTVGSISQVDSEMLNRRISTDLLSRLEDIVPGLVINRNVGSGRNNITIRGQSTLFANAKPLIVLDNFPYEGDLDNINPNDIESITVLKDAAAASIWGVRAGNGVIVITTKTGKYKQNTKVEANLNNTVGQKRNLFYVPEMSSSDYIDTEIALFAKGYYTNNEVSLSRPPLSPVVELLIAKRDGKINAAFFEKEINLLRQYSLKQEETDHLLQKSLHFQQSYSLSGGTENNHYSYSLGHDQNRAGRKGNSYNRFTFKAFHNQLFFDKKLEIGLSLQVANGKEGLNAVPNDISSYPYTRIVDEQGKALAVAKNYRALAIENVENLGLLNWQFKPLEELEFANHFVRTEDHQANLKLFYRPTVNWNFSLLYLFSRGRSTDLNLQSMDSYFTRNLINRVAQRDANGIVNWVIPLGSIKDEMVNNYVNNNFRFQTTFEKTYGEMHHFRFFSGYEIKSLDKSLVNNRLYGYDEEHAKSAVVDYFGTYPGFVNPQTSISIENRDYEKGNSDRFLSYFLNLNYSFNNRLLISGSARLDQSNLFGVNTNQRGVPLWSAGLGWNISNENFYHWKLIPHLKASVTYGYSGNLDRSLSGYTTARYDDGKSTIVKVPYAGIVNPPNPELRWEKIAINNYKLEFALKNSILSGSFEFYQKKGYDLIGSTPHAPSSGITVFRGNTANIQGEGVEVLLNTSVSSGQFNWRPTFVFSYSADKVTKYLVKSDINSIIQLGNGIGIFPVMGRPLYGIYSYEWAGLDPATGDPQGYLNGNVSRDYTSIRAAANVDNIVFNGPSRPVYYGMLNNHFSYHHLSLSIGLSYRLGYAFRQSSISYGNVMGLGGHGDWYKRWQKPGDEIHTSIPSLPLVANTNRDVFYRNSQVLVERGDHVRLQDIRINYLWNDRALKKIGVAKINIYSYLNNLGVVWTANKRGVDPDFIDGPLPKTIAFGIRCDF